MATHIALVGACLLCTVLYSVLCAVPSVSNSLGTTPLPKTTMEFGGWKPMRPGPPMRSFRRSDRYAGGRYLNASALAVADTTKSFLLVYPPKNGKVNEGRSARNKAFGPPSNTETPLRTYAPAPRRHKVSSNVERLASNPSPHVRGKPKGQSSDPSSLPTSNHHVQIQLLDGYIVPSQQASPNQHSQTSISGIPAPIKAVPVNFNTVPEIRLLLPGDVHQQLQNLHSGQQSGDKINKHNDNLGEPPNRQRPYNGGTNQGQNYNTYSQPEINNRPQRPETGSYPDNNRDSRNNWQNPNPEPILDPRAPPNPQDVNGFVPNVAPNDNTQKIQAHGYAYTFSKTTNLNQQNQNYNFNNGNRGNPNQYGRQPSEGQYNQGFNPGNAQQGGYGTRNNRNSNGHAISNGFRPLASGYGNQNGQSPGNNFGSNGQRFNNNNNNGIYYMDFNHNNKNNNNYGPYDKPNCPHHTSTTTTEQSEEGTGDLPLDARTQASDAGATGDSSTVPETTDVSTATDEAQTGTEQTEQGTEDTTTDAQSEKLREEVDQTFFLPSRASSRTPQRITSSNSQVQSGGSARSPAFTTQQQVRDTDLNGRLTDQSQSLNDGSVSPGMISGSSSLGMTTGSSFCDCQQSCAPVQYSSADNMGSTIREIARNLNADSIFDFLGITDEEISTALKTNGGYTLFLPSNEAISRLPTNFLEEWRQPNSGVATALENHVVAGPVGLNELKIGGRMQSTASGATLFINNYNNEAVTVNGHRIVRGDVSTPDGGVVHVIDGMLCPVADRDLIDTVRACGKYDGFLTLADVTKLMETMQGEGPYTVFLPSNDALTKIPDEELNVLKENVTALKEFLQYHIVEGVYFSEDLKDGQYLSTLLHKQPIKLGVRVDGCFRRLVEVNNSPVFKADIPTKNGVIHIVDWILRPSDLEWCQGVILP